MKMISDETSLQHFGILGMKWGIRRYQNPNGSLTSEGTKKYESMNPNALTKTIKKQVQGARKTQYGAANQWNTSKTIGKNSQEFAQKQSAAMKKYQSTPEYKQLQAKMKHLNTQLDNNKISPDEYDKSFAQLHKQLSTNGPDQFGGKSYGSRGTMLLGKNAAKVVKGMNTAYVKDLGYDDAASKLIVDKIMTSKGKTVFF